MDNKKKLIGYLKLLLSLLFGVLYVNLSTISEASTHFNYTSGELSNIYYNLRASSLANSEVEDTTYHDKVVTRWASGDILMESLTDNDWLNIITDLNNFMESYYRSSGDFNEVLGEDYKDHASDIYPYWIFVQPCQTYSTSAESINFIFVPYMITYFQINETTSNVNGIRFYKPQSQLFGRSGDASSTGISVYNAVLLRINPNKTYTIKTNQQGIEYSSVVASTLSGNGDFFRRKNPIFYNPYTGISYPINVILAYRNNLTTGFYWLNSVGYGELVETKTNFQYNLLTGTITSGDSSGTVPGGSGEGSTDIDLSETNGLLTEIVGALTSEATSGDFMSADSFSGELISSLGSFTVEDVSDGFFYSMFNALELALRSNSGDILEIPFYDTSIVLDSSDFEIHNELLSDVIRLAFLVGFIFTEFHFMHKIILLLRTGGLGSILNWLYKKDYSDFL